MADRAFLERLHRELIDKGKLIEAGWISMRLATLPPDTAAVQLNAMRIAFFAGAQHLFGSIMIMMEPGEEPTEKDLERFDQIRDELDRFLEDFKLKHTKSRGRA